MHTLIDNGASVAVQCQYNTILGITRVGLHCKRDIYLGLQLDQQAQLMLRILRHRIIFNRSNCSGE